MLINSYVGLDISSAEIRIIAVRNQNIYYWNSEPLPEGVVKAGVIQDATALGVIISNLFQSRKLPRNRVICSLTGLPFIYRTISMPGKGQQVSNEAILREARREMSLAEDDMYISWKVIELHPEISETDFFVLGVPKSALNLLLNSLSQANIKPYMIDIKPLALARAASMQDATIISLERDYFDIILVTGGRVRMIHSVNPSFGSDTKNNIVELMDEFNRVLKSFSRDFPQEKLDMESPILISGELLLKEEILKLLQDISGRQVALLKPVINTSSKIAAEYYGAALGLLMKKTLRAAGQAQYRDINLNLLSGTRKKRFKVSTVSVLATAGIVVACFAVVFWLHGIKDNEDLRVEFLKMESSTTHQKVMDAQKNLKGRNDLKKSLQSQQQQIQGQVAAIQKDEESISNRKIDYTSRIIALTGAIPANGDYSVIRMGSDQIVLEGTVQNTLDVISMNENIEAMTYFKETRIVSLAPWNETGATFNVVITNQPGE